MLYVTFCEQENKIIEDLLWKNSEMQVEKRFKNDGKILKLQNYKVPKFHCSKIQEIQEFESSKVIDFLDLELEFLTFQNSRILDSKVAKF